MPPPAGKGKDKGKGKGKGKAEPGQTTLGWRGQRSPGPPAPRLFDPYRASGPFPAQPEAAPVLPTPRLLRSRLCRGSGSSSWKG